MIYLYPWQVNLKKHQLVHLHFTKRNQRKEDQEFMLNQKLVN